MLAIYRALLDEIKRLRRRRAVTPRALEQLAKAADRRRAGFCFGSPTVASVADGSRMTVGSRADARRSPAVAVVGGGLAGLAAAVALAEPGCRVDLFEAAAQLGGRAASFRDPATGELVDHCQHVSMGCCTNLADFCRRDGHPSIFRRDRHAALHRPRRPAAIDFAAARWLPAPLHLARGFLGIEISVAGRSAAASRGRCGSFARTPRDDPPTGRPSAEWLRCATASRRGRSSSSGAWSWSARWARRWIAHSLAAARKVIVDGFLAPHEAYAIDVPLLPLGKLYGEQLATGWPRMASRCT